MHGEKSLTDSSRPEDLGKWDRVAGYYKKIAISTQTFDYWWKPGLEGLLPYAIQTCVFGSLVPLQ